MSLDLTQSEADNLIGLEKHRVSEDAHAIPEPGARLELELVAAIGNERFHLDINRGRIKLSKVTFQNRWRQTTILVRVDLDGPTHENPDGTEVPCPHLHVFREGWGDKWAVPLPREHFRENVSILESLDDFFSYCNISRPPRIQGRLQ